MTSDQSQQSKPKIMAPHIMGIVNVTPDSFSDGGRFGDPQAAINHALQLTEDGADILDIGGESTRPGAAPVPVKEELRRVMPVVEGLVGKTKAALSIDTRKPDVARAAVAAGAAIWNDVSALAHDDASVATAAALDCSIVLMHAQGSPRTMQQDPSYTDVVQEVLGFLAARIEVCAAAGIDRARLIVDPGIGFGKSADHNLALIANLDKFQPLGCPVLLGASRKRFISALDRQGPADQRLGGSLAAVLAGFARGAAIFRVHDVAETRQTLIIAQGIAGAIENP
jgi:dihydropteroate synthase